MVEDQPFYSEGSQTAARRSACRAVGGPIDRSRLPVPHVGLPRGVDHTHRHLGVGQAGGAGPFGQPSP